MDDNQGALAGSKTDKPGLSRRTLLHAATLHAAALGTGLTAAPLAASESTARRRRPVVVIGAGAFGGWTALWLQRQGADVTLIDTWGPGHSRASSGGESRVIRGMYGVDRVYTEWVVRAFEIWRDSARRWDADLYHPTGALWMFRGDDGYARASAPVLADAGLIAEPLTRKTARQRYPHIDFTGIEHLWYEAEAGYLTARRACRRVAQALVEEGGELRSAHVRPGPLDNGQMEYIELDNGERIHADAYVFACGPWLGDLFPDVIGDKINPSRQDVFYFGPPAGNHAFAEGRFPVWIDFGERIFYGVPGNEHRGFKIADDTHGPTIDPDRLERTPDPAALERARRLIATRFPAMADAPVVESRVCQYASTPDGQYLIDRHPGAGNVWLLGGGSGHGYKLGPALGEQVATWVLDDATPLPRFALDRAGMLTGGGESQLETGGQG